MDLITRYIFSWATNLFSEDISGNFIILSTFANKEIIRNGPYFINSIATDLSDFYKIIRGMGEKWWFAFNSKCVLENDEDKLTKYSFSQLNEFYEEKIKKLCQKSTRKSVEILEARNQLIIHENLLIDSFRNLLKIKEKEKTPNKIKLEIGQNEFKEKINNTRNQIAFVIIKLKYISKKIENIAINNNYLQTKYEFIDSIIESDYYYGELTVKDLKKMMENIKLLREVYNLKDDEILNLNNSQLEEKLEVIISL